MPEGELRRIWAQDLVRLAMAAKAGDDGRPAAPGPFTAAASRAGGYAGHIRLRRSPASGDVASVEYELFRGRVYRIRWELADRFAVPIMDVLVAQASSLHGAADYHQAIAPRLGSPQASLERAGWSQHGRLFEIRQLNPQGGGPVFVTITHLGLCHDIIAAGGGPAPEPDRRAEPWWRRAGRATQLPAEERRRELAHAFAGLLRGIGFPCPVPGTGAAR